MAGAVGFPAVVVRHRIDNLAFTLHAWRDPVGGNLHILAPDGTPWRAYLAGLYRACWRPAYHSDGLEPLEIRLCRRVEDHAGQYGF